jgi:lysophospholipase L1-like esterase
MPLRSRRILYACIATLCGVVVSLVIVETALRFYTAYVQSREQMDPGFLAYDPQLGWQMAPNWSGRHVHFDFDAHYTTNAAGLRGNAWPEPSASTDERVVFIGDSFTFGLGVNDDETFVARLQAGAAGTYLNAGIAGYSTDQQLLYLRTHLASWRVDRLVLVVYLANDLLDNELRFPLQAQMGKPLFVAGRAGIQLTNSPVPRAPKTPEDQARTLGTAVLGQEIPRTWRNEWQLTRTLGLAESTDPALLAGMPERLEAPVDLFVQLVAAIRELCEANDVSLSLVLMPGRSFVELPDSLSAAFQEHLRREILARQNDIGVPVIDLASQLRDRYEATGERLFFPNEGHLNPAGHREVAELLTTVVLGSDPKI